MSNLRLGIFVVAMLAVFGAGIFWIGSQTFLFSPTYRLNADFDNVVGLADGAVVRVGGTHQGTVQHIELPRRPGDKVRVQMALRNSTRDVIKKDSRAAIHSEGIVGDKYVEVAFGSEDAPNVKDGDTIQAEPPLDIADLIKKTNVILDSAQGAMQNIGAAAGNLQSISAKVNNGSGTVGALINDKTVFQQAAAGATAFREDMEAMKHNFLTSSFFHKRGYENEADLMKYAVAKLPAQSVTRKFTYEGSRVFANADTAKFKKESILNDAGKFLESSSFGAVVVAGYGDMKGDTEEERTLAAARAMVVREYLVKSFKVDDTRVRTIGFGKTPDVPDGGRIEVLVYPAGTQLVAAATSPAPRAKGGSR